MHPIFLNQFGLKQALL